MYNIKHYLKWKTYNNISSLNNEFIQDFALEKEITFRSIIAANSDCTFKH